MRAAFRVPMVSVLVVAGLGVEVAVASYIDLVPPTLPLLMAMGAAGAVGVVLLPSGMTVGRHRGVLGGSGVRRLRAPSGSVRKVVDCLALHAFKRVSVGSLVTSTPLPRRGRALASYAGGSEHP